MARCTGEQGVTEKPLRDTPVHNSNISGASRELHLQGITNLFHAKAGVYLMNTRF